MADRVFVLPSDSFEPFAGRFVHPRMAADLRTLADVSNEVIEDVATALQIEARFVDSDGLIDIVTRIAQSPEVGMAIGRIVINVDVDEIDETLELIRNWRDENPENAEAFPENSFVQLSGKLRSVVRGYPCVERWRKARQLTGVTGNEAKDIELICDLRPVFDKDRSRVDGLIPITLLKLEYHTQDGETATIEVRLSSELLDELEKTVRKAQKKLAVLKSSIPQWIPNGLADFS